MRVATPAQRLSLAVLLVATVYQASYAETKESEESFQAHKLPSFEGMLAIAMKHNPNVRVAQAELDRARLHVANEIRDFRDEWQAQLSTLAAAEMAIKDAERLSLLETGAIAGRRVQEAQRLAASSREQAALAQGTLKELKAMLPLLLGAAVAAAPVGNNHPGHNNAAHAHDHGSAPIPPAVEKILRDRLQVLVEVMQLQQEAYKNQEVGFDAVAASQLDLLAARLELASTHEERLKVRQEMVQIARQIEEVASRLLEGNEATRADVLKARALRLRAEADLKLENGG